MKGQEGAITRAPNHSGGAKKSQHCHTYILQYSTFVSGRPQVRKQGRRTCILARAPSDLVTPMSIRRSISSRNPSTHFYVAKLRCRQTADSRTALAIAEAGFSFSFWRLVKSCVSNTFSTLHSYFYCCLSFYFQGHQALKNKLVKKDHFHTAQQQSRTANATAFVMAGQFI